MTAEEFTSIWKKDPDKWIYRTITVVPTTACHWRVVGTPIKVTIVYGPSPYYHELVVRYDKEPCADRWLHSRYFSSVFTRRPLKEYVM